MVPSGAPTKVSYKQLNFIDGKSRYGGLGTQKAGDNVNNIVLKQSSAMMYVIEQAIDRAMIALDGTLR